MMNESQSNPEKQKPVTLEQFIAFNDELAALSEAKIPIPLGLKNAGAHQPRALQQITRRITTYMENGKSLEEAINLEKDQFPQMYSHVVEAGIRSGNISSALQTVSSFTWDFVKIRQSLARAMIYPMFTVILAYVLFILFLKFIAIRLESTFVSMDVEPGWFMTGLTSLSDILLPWFWVPLVFLLIIFYFLLRKQRSTFGLSRLSILFSWFPGFKKIVEDYHCATFSEILAILIEHKTPLHEALKLAAETTGDKKIINSTINMKGEIESGKSLKSLSEQKQLPSYLWYLITRTYQENYFTQSLKNASEMYRTRARDRSERLQKMFPVLTTIMIGGTAVLIYGLCLFIPLIDLYEKSSLAG